MLNILITVLALTVPFSVVHAQDATAEYIYNTRTGEKMSVETFAATRKVGEIVVFGETHAFEQGDPATIAHHLRQVQLLQLLSNGNHHVRTGMEFLNYTDQEAVDAFSTGRMTQNDFLAATHWPNGEPFEFYREQILLPPASGGRTLGLNIPRSVTGQVAKGGPDSLTEQQKALLPPIWERGSDAYYARFKEVMQDSVPAEKLPNYFWAQSLWDDTMAWNALKNPDPEAVTVIIVGGFHVEYGLGLPSRLRRQGATQVTTLLQADAPLSDDPTYGPRADFIWVHP